MVLIVVIGVYPRPIFERIRPSVEVIADAVRRRRAEVAPEQTVAGRTPPANRRSNLAPLIALTAISIPPEGPPLMIPSQRL